MSRGPRGPRKRNTAPPPPRPIAVEYEDEDIDLRDTPEYKRRQLIIRIGTTILLFAFITTSGITCVGTALSGDAGTSQDQPGATPGQPIDELSAQIAAVEAQLKKEPDSAENKAALGAYLMQRAGQAKDGAADLGKARQQFEDVIAKDPKNYRVLLLLGQTLKMQKDSAKAIETLKQVLVLAAEPVDPKAPDKDAQVAARQGTQEVANLTLAQIEYEAKNLDGALAYLDSSLKLNPGNAQSYLLRARVQMERKQPEAARKDFQFALDVAQRLPDGLEQRAIVINALDGLKQLSPKSSATPTPKGSATPSLPVSLPTATPSSANTSLLPTATPSLVNTSTLPAPGNATSGNSTP